MGFSSGQQLFDKIEVPRPRWRRCSRLAVESIRPQDIALLTAGLGIMSPESVPTCKTRVVLTCLPSWAYC
eukprot:6051853-Amphidinium_carterae.1